MWNIKKAGFAGVLIGLLGLLISVSPIGIRLEEGLGLAFLFHWRGVREAPEEVVIIAMDKASADQMNLPRDTRKWPRKLHAATVTALSEAGARLIAFDIFFKEARENDQVLRQAIEAAGNVVLIQSLEKEGVGNTPLGKQQDSGLTLEKVVPPTPALAEVSAANAVFPLPKVPVRVNQFWLFKNRSAALPTLPVTALQVYGTDAMAEFFELIQKRIENPQAFQIGNNPDTISALSEILNRQAKPWGEKGLPPLEILRDFRHVFLSYPEIPQSIVADGLSGGNAKILNALVRMYAAEDSRFINYYGPAGTIKTVPYHEFVTSFSDGETASPKIDVKGKAVFIGYSQSVPDAERKDDFHTVFSEENGVDLSGVEIAATAFSNLLENRTVRPLNGITLASSLFFWGMVLGLIWGKFPPGKALFFTTLTIGVYGMLTYNVFTAEGLWLPVITPLLVQAPLGGFGVILWRLFEAKKEERTIKSRFELYVPKPVVDHLSLQTENIHSTDQLVYGVVLHSDIKNFTTLSESMQPDALGRLMSDYFETIFVPVKRHGGTVLNVTGDAMLALWSAPISKESLRVAACKTALEISKSLRTFNQKRGDVPLSTRIGLHCGQTFLGNIGGGHRLEYTAMGDMINTASRIEGLNNAMGTHRLASEEVLEGSDDFLTRPLGTFLLSGKHHTLEICELIAYKHKCYPEQEELCRNFSTGLALYRHRRWSEAAALFSKLIAQQGHDGPSLFYLKRCQALIEHSPPDTWSSIIRLDKNK